MKRPKLEGLRAGLAAAAGLLCLILFLPVVASAAATVTYTEDTDLVLPGAGATLKIVAGSSTSGLLIGQTSFTPTIEGADTFTVRHPGPNPKYFTDGTDNYCRYLSGNNEYNFTSAHSGKTISVSETTCPPPSSSSGGGSAYTTPYIFLSAPNGGQSLAPGSIYTISWSAGGTGVAAIRLSLSVDGGLTYDQTIAASTGNTSFYDWTVPDIASSASRIKAEAINTAGTVLASDDSDADFAITGQPAQPGTEAGAPPPPQQEQPASAQPVPPPVTATIAPGSLIKGSLSAVYYVSAAGKRYLFPNSWTFLTWYPDFSKVITVSDAALAAIPMGGNVTYKPGVRMIKLTTDPKVYVVSSGGVLRWVTTEAVAAKLYGPDWNKMIDDMPAAFFANYLIGAPITAAEVGL